jgi:hypothetical protein
VTGEFLGRGTFGTTELVSTNFDTGFTAGFSAGFVLNLDANGNFRWVAPFMGSGTASASTVEVDGSGNVCAGGRYSGWVDFDPSGRVSTLDSAGGAFVTKLTSSGSLVWARGLTAGGFFSSTYGLTIDAIGNVYATGNFYSSIDLNPGAGSVIRTTSGPSDSNIFVVKLSSSGNYVWGETFGSTGLDIGYGLAIDNEGDVVLGGMFSDIVDFDPNPLSEYAVGSAGSRFEGFILRLNQS